jgi:ribonucleoside-diphosphate reductase alpha chain
MLVIKRDGSSEALDLEKIHKVLSWACNGSDHLNPIKGVSVSQIEMQAKIHFHNKMKTKDIHECLIKAAADLISEDYPNYESVAARLVWFGVRKEAYGSFDAPTLYEIVKKNVKLGVYTKELLEMYTEQEFATINGFIDHDRDDLFKYAGSEQMRKKYLVQNRKTKTVYESFQIPYILVPTILFASYDKEVRMSYIKRFYDVASQHYISLPTPIMSGLRTKTKQFSSCTVIDSGDSLDSIMAAGNAIVSYASKKAGIGLNIGRLRAVGQPVRGGEAVTTGVIPFAKKFNGDLKSCSQGAVRGASATFSFPGWHLEFENLIELKNNRGTDETRIRTVDYNVHLNKLFYERLSTNGVITLFSPEEVPELYDLFYSSDYNGFKTEYESCERSTSLTKKKIPASEWFSKVLSERFETGRIYLMHADLINKNTPFYQSIYQSNLCMEIALPTTPVTLDGEGEIALCTLAAINWGKFSKVLSEKDLLMMQECCELLVRALDSLLTYQDYPHIAAKRSVDKYRPLGIGIIGFAHYLARSRVMWGSEEALQCVDELMQIMTYSLLSTSCDLAVQFGACEKTKYHDGILNFDTSNSKLDWESLKNRMKQHGVRNATLMALMPSETSSQLSNETSGIEPPRDLITIKGSKDGVLPQVVPEYTKLNNVYETLWDVSVPNYLKTIAVLQKYVDQSISTNTSYNPKGGNIQMSQLLQDLVLAYKLGIKTLYYCNTNDGMDEQSDDGCAGGACKI